MFILLCVAVIIISCLYDVWFAYSKACNDYDDCCHEETMSALSDIYRIEQKKLSEEEEAQKRLEQIYKMNAETVIRRTRTVAEKDGMKIAQEVVEYD